jgi:tripartite-type tricarboxylate transporter receptor subunit TctC
MLYGANRDLIGAAVRLEGAMRKLACTIALAINLVASASHCAWSQSAGAYPTRLVRWVVGFPPGGLSDIVARLMAQWLSERLGQPFIIENRPGAASNIATEAVVHAPADGYTLLMVSGGNAINTTFYDQLNFNFSRDIAPVAGIMRLPYVMEINPSIPAKSVPEFVTYAKAMPGMLNYASGGMGTTLHIVGELFKLATGTNLVHVPYRGTAPALSDLLGGHVQMMFDNLPSSIGYVRTGQLRALAVTTATRSPALPDVPTVGDFLPGFEASGWQGVGAPRNTPREIIEKLSKAVNAAIADPKIEARFADLGGAPFPLSPADLAKLIADETEKWAKVIRAANIKAE